MVGHLGPDVLGPVSLKRPSPGGVVAEFWDEPEAISRLLREPSRPIVEALLDRNLWAGETCYLRGVNPWRPAGTVDLPGLVRLARRMMRQASETGMQVTTGNPRRGESHWVYGRSGQPCRRCGSAIEFTPDVPGEPYRRDTWWCPRCQPAGD